MIWKDWVWFALVLSNFVCVFIFGVICTHTQKGNIFLSDYKMLDELVGNVVSGRQQYLTAPLVLLYCNPQGMMLPIAIQVRIYKQKYITNKTSAL